MLEFSEAINCIFGSNGSGKTNLLEAVYFLTYGKSFRKNTGFPQMISVDGERAEMVVSSLIEGGKTLTLKATQEGRGWFSGTKPSKRSNHPFDVVFVNPFDAYNFYDKPAFRRSWMDRKMSSLNRTYSLALGRFHRALKFKNSLLGLKPHRFREQVLAVDRDIAEMSYLLTKERIKFLGNLNPLLTKTFFKMFSGRHELRVVLESQFSRMGSEDIFQSMRMQSEKDEQAGFMTYSVNRDDYIFLFDEMDSLEYCSLGQQKMGFLSLVFAYISLFGYKFGVPPIVLIDDVSGELDKVRWRNFISYLEGCVFQVLITTANEAFKSEIERSKKVKLIVVESGSFL